MESSEKDKEANVLFNAILKNEDEDKKGEDKIVLISQNVIYDIDTVNSEAVQSVGEANGVAVSGLITNSIEIVTY